MRARVCATQDWPGPALLALRDRVDLVIASRRGPPSRDALLRGAADAEGLLCLLTDRIDDSLMDACPGLRVISTISVGVDHIDLGAASARGITVGHTPGVLTETTADLAFALLLSAARRVGEGDRMIREGGWVQERVWEPDLLLGNDVHGATLGLVGLGAIARAVARRAHGFGMRVLAWNRSVRVVERVSLCSLEEVLERSDFLSIHVARTPETLGLIGPPELARMKPGAVLVNTARGGIVDELELAAALETGRLGAAALDVFAVEPLAPDHPLLRAPRSLLTPHIGSATHKTRERMAELAIANLEAGLAGARLRFCANPV